MINGLRVNALDQATGVAQPPKALGWQGNP